MASLTREELCHQAHLLSERAQLFSRAISDPPSAAQPTDVSAEEVLEKDCDELKMQILQIKDKCGSLPSIPSEDSPPGLMLQLYTLEAELAAWQKQTVPILSSKNAVVEASTEYELRKNVEQLHGILPVIRGMRVAAERKLRREQELLQEMQMMENTLRQKLSEEEGSEASGQSSRRHERTLQEAERTCTTLREKLGEFVDKYISQPSENGGPRENLRSQRKIQTMIDRGRGDKDEPRVTSLPDYIEQLITHCITTPHDPYISIDALWEPHFQLLLRSGILQRHPDNPSLVRITPFHH